MVTFKVNWVWQDVTESKKYLRGTSETFPKELEEMLIKEKIAVKSDKKNENISN